MYLGRSNKLLTYWFTPARAWKVAGEIKNQMVARSNAGVDVYSISPRCFLPLTGRDWFSCFLLDCVFKQSLSKQMCVCVRRGGGGSVRVFKWPYVILEVKPNDSPKVNVLVDVKQIVFDVTGPLFDQGGILCLSSRECSHIQYMCCLNKIRWY